MARHYILVNGLTSLTMPYELFSRLLSKYSFTEAERKERLSLHKKRLESFERSIPYNKYVEIMSMKRFEKFDPETLLRYDSLEFFTDKAVEGTPEDIILHLSNIVALLKKYENFEIKLINLDDIINQNESTLSFKEDSVAFATSCSANGDNPVAIALKEEYTIKGVEQYLLNLMDYVPESKSNKKSIIKRLENLIKMLADWEKRSATIQ